MNGTSSHITFKLGQPLPPIPAPPAALELERPFGPPVPTQKVWLLFVSNVRSARMRSRLIQLDFNPAVKKPLLFWRRFAEGRREEMLATSVKLENLGLKPKAVLKTQRKRRINMPLSARPRRSRQTNHQAP